MRNHGLRKGEGCSLGYGNIQLFKRLYCIQIGKKLVVTFCFSSGQLRRFCLWTKCLCFGSWIISKKNSGDLKEEEILEQGNYFIMELKKRVFFLSSTEHSLRVFHLDGVMRGWKFSLHFVLRYFPFSFHACMVKRSIFTCHCLTAFWISLE